jgi:uncharacterized protein YabN with tetrapyrrole methylase and pyrophosphatase domain
MGQKVAEAAFDWSSPEAAKAKVDEEMAEVEEAVARGDGEAIAAELGDLLFALSSYIRLLGFNSETILQATLDRFRRRFQTMEAELAKAGIDIHDAGPEEMEKGWQKAKLSESA